MGMASKKKAPATPQKGQEIKTDKGQESPALDMLAGLVNKQKPEKSTGGIVNSFKRTARH